MSAHPCGLTHWTTIVFLIAALSPGAFTVEAAPSSAEEEWPQWRGPLGTGVAPAANPPVAWSETSNIKWKVKIPGSGAATPIIWEKKVFIQTAVPTGKKVEAPAQKAESTPEDDQAEGKDRSKRRRGGGGGRSGPPTEAHQFLLLCLDRETGKTLWQKVAGEEVPHEGHHADHGFSSHSPITDGKHVFAYFGSRGLHCYDLEGNFKWKKDLGQMSTRNSFGEGSSPGLFGKTIVINWDHQGDDFIVALDTETGKELWRQPRNEDTSWSTPLIVQHAGGTQVVTAASSKVRSYDLKSGKLIWECAGLTSNVIPSPVAGNDMVYVTSGYRGNALLAIRLGRTGDLTDTDGIAWKHSKSTPYVPSPLLYDNKLYFFASNNGILSCLDARTGNPLIEPARLEGLQGVYASPVGASGKIYLVGRNGTTVVIKLSDKLEVLATNRLDERFEASPAAAGKELYLRGHEYLYCIAEKS